LGTQPIKQTINQSSGADDWGSRRKNRGEGACVCPRPSRCGSSGLGAVLPGVSRLRTGQGEEALGKGEANETEGGKGGRRRGGGQGVSLASLTHRQIRGLEQAGENEGKRAQGDTGQHQASPSVLAHGGASAREGGGSRLRILQYPTILQCLTKALSVSRSNIVEPRCYYQLERSTILVSGTAGQSR